MRRAFLFLVLLIARAQQDPFKPGDQLIADHKFAEAAIFFQEALDHAGDRTMMARALLGLGRARFNLDELTPAREALEKSASLAEAAGDWNGTAEALRVLANVCRPMGLLQESKDAAERARALFAKSGNQHHATGMLISLALTVGEMGDTQEKIALLRQCLREIGERGFHDLESTVITDLAVVYFDQGDYEHAIEYSSRATKIDEQASAPDHLALSRGYANMGVSAARLSRDRDALEYYARAIREAEMAKHALMVNFTRWNRAYFYRTRGQPARALEDIRPAAEYYEHSENKTQGILVRSEFAETLLDLGDTDGAARLASELVSEARRYDSPHPLQSALEILGQASLRLGRRDQARAAFKEDISLTESARMRLVGNASEKQNAISNQVVSYHGMVQLLAAEGRIGEALEFAERAKARILIDALATAPQTGAMTPEEKRRELELSAEVTRMDMRIARDHSADALTAFQRAGDALDNFRIDLYKTHPELRFRRGEFQPISRDQIQELLRDDSAAILEYVVTRDRTYLFAITRRDITIYTLASPSMLARNVRQFREQLARRDSSYRQTAALLWNQVLRPAESAIRGKKLLIVVPDGQLWNLPFQAMTSPSGHHVIEDAAIFYAPSLTGLRELQRRPRSATPQGLLALAGPDPAGAITEARRVGDLYSKERDVLIGDRATKQRWTSIAPDYRILHVATHGILNSSAPLYSYLSLAGDDGRLTAREVLDLHLNADLAVLSACETGLGGFRAGEGLVGMSWAFLLAGSRTTVVSQWKVDSAATTQLMTSLHRNLRSVSRAEALRRAALALLESPDYRHPFYWAGFVMVGDGH